MDVGRGCKVCCGFKVFFFFGLKFIKPVIITIIRDKDREK